MPSHRRAMHAIEQCRTEALGGQVYTCPECGQVLYSYHSCRNRLAALRQQLQNAFPDCDESGDAEQGQELAASALAPILRCPSCDQAMRLQQTIQPTGRCPP